VIRRISQDLFLEDLDAQEARMNSDVPADFDAVQYEHRVYRETDVESAG
jgi:hypothetical protein